MNRFLWIGKRLHFVRIGDGEGENQNWPCEKAHRLVSLVTGYFYSELWPTAVEMLTFNEKRPVFVKLSLTDLWYFDSLSYIKRTHWMFMFLTIYNENHKSNFRISFSSGKYLIFSYLLIFCSFRKSQVITSQLELFAEIIGVLAVSIIYVGYCY